MTQERSQVEQIFAGNSEMARLMRSLDWSQTSLGPVETWSQSLRSALSICLNSRFPIAIYWGPDCLLLYNDAWRPIVGDKHSWAVGRPAREVWSEIWDDIGSELAGVLATGEGTFHKDDLLSMYRFGYTEECYFEYTFNPIQGQDGIVDGVINIVSETTYRVLTDRRAQLLRELASKTGIAKTAEESCALIIEAFKSDPFDIPFALLYLIDPDGKYARLRSGIKGVSGSPVSPETIEIAAKDDPNGWPIALAARTTQPQVVNNVVSRFGALPGSPWAEPPQEAMVLPIAAPGYGKVSGVLIAVASPRRRLDDNYCDFFTQVAGQIAMAIANAQAYEVEWKRAEALAELDRAKTAFFSNVSHEFRTPLTLMLSPLEDTLARLDETLPPQEREQLQLVQRNGMRLLKLVNSLLDFSRIEAGRVQTFYEPIDLATYTAELASTFRSLIERAGMSLIVECRPLPEAVYVDREMWEKIVLNLLSNAFKFTMAGKIVVGLQWLEHQVELTVADTGVGIPPKELPLLFERFHRVGNSQGRSFEGSGIGLSLVLELVKLHGGEIRVTSTVGQGSCFAVTIPTGSAHLPNERISANCTLASTTLRAMPYVEEARRWLTTDEEMAVEDSLSSSSERFLEQTNPLGTISATASTARILLVDDNADMRDYIQRLLSASYAVQAVADGMVAKAAIENNPPDLVLTDVMMPRMNGFELLRWLRNAPATQDIPVILLSARAGEEARIEGLEAGADDYLIKPFSARELMARVEATLKLAQLRKTAQQRERVLQLETQAVTIKLEQVLSSLRDGFFTLDRNWCYTYINNRQLEIIKMSREAVLGTNVWNIFPDIVETEIYQHFQAAMTSRVMVQFENYYAPLDGWFDHRIYPTTEGIAVLVTDISERKRIEAQREQLLQQEQAAREAAEQANQIKDEFLAVLSHELRSPLNPILGWSKLLQQGKLDAVKTKIALTTIERNAQLQVQLIEDLLDISRILRGKLSLNVLPVDLRAVIAAALETVMLAVEAKALCVQTTISPDVGIVMGDAGRLQQVVWNLLSNAIKFTSQGGQIVIALTQAGTDAQISVSDTGKGIEPGFLPYIFEYFRQEDASTTRKFGGLGLGLAIARQIVELHGGTIAVDSLGVGQGATFTVRIPLALQSSTMPSVKQLSEPISDLRGRKILIVDDDVDSSELISFVLEQEKALVTVASSGLEALQIIERSIPDLVISDIGMPEMDGYMLMQQMRTTPQGKQIPAIALTAYAGEMDRQQAEAAGFQLHLAKPVEPTQLLAAISNLIKDNQ